MKLQDADFYSMIKNFATKEKVYLPKIFNPLTQRSKVIRKYKFNTATKAIEKGRELQEKVNNTLAEMINSNKEAENGEN